MIGAEDGEVLLDDLPSNRRSGLSGRQPADGERRYSLRKSSMPLDATHDAPSGRDGNSQAGDHAYDENIGIIRETLAELDDEDGIVAVDEMVQKLDQVSNDSKPKSMKTPK